MHELSLHWAKGNAISNVFLTYRVGKERMAATSHLKGPSQAELVHGLKHSEVRGIRFDMLPAPPCYGLAMRPKV